MKNIFIFIGRNFTFLCFIVLQILCIVMLSKYSKTHEVFFASAANEITGKINSDYNGFSSYFTLKQVNRHLAEENASLRNSLKNDFGKMDNSSKTVLDSLNKDTSGHYYRKFTFLPAEVVGNSVTSQTNYLTLERGSRQGIRKGMSVVGPQGIVGVVVDVSDNFSRVMGLLHRNSKVSAMLKKDKSFGSIEWDGVDPSYLIMKNIPKGAKLAKGDTVVTSTYSANFPPNLVIGTVAAITADPSSNFYTLKIKTATNFYNIQYVYVVANSMYAEQTRLENNPQESR